MHPREKQKLSQEPKIVSATPDSLPWRETSPGQLDDYEGFFGLEEVEDVAVVRDDATGRLSFHHAGPSPPTDNTPSPASKAWNASAQEEWQGFSDDGSDSASLPSGEAESSHFEMLAEDSAPAADITQWAKLDCLSPTTLTSISGLGFQKPMPIQASAIPHIIQGDDLIGKAPTGSGKTLAFGLPIYERWLARPEKGFQGPIALIMEPARELAHQIETHLSRLRREDGKGLRLATITGGLSSQKQKRLIQSADVIIATPGRLWDLMGEDRAISQAVKAISMLVVDEADRLLSHGHFQELEHILNALDREEYSGPGDEMGEGDEPRPTPRRLRQTLVFSATFAKELQQKLGRITKQKFSKEQSSMGYLLQKLKFRHQPKLVDINPDTQMASNLTEALLEVSDMNKDLYLYSLLLLFQPQASIRALVFVNSISAVRRIVPFLQLLGFAAQPLHSNMEQKARLRSLERFSNKIGQSSSVLVATDVAARGLDIPEVDAVMHYHVPRQSDMYIHRSGRTARAEASGSSILMAGANEAAGVKRLISQVHAEKPRWSKRELRIITIDDHVLDQLRPRAQLAKKIADTEQSKEKASGGDKVFQEAADDLGIDLADLDELTDGKGGAKGKKRKQQQAEAQSISKAELKGAKAELKSMLSQRLKMSGVSERYLANGRVDVGALMREKEQGGQKGLFLGDIKGLHLL